MKKDLLSISGLTQEDFNDIIETALVIKADPLKYYGVFQGRTAVLIFDKPSLRTRVTFEVAMNQFGGNSLYIPGKDISLGERESVSDGAKNLSRWVDVIIMRTFGHDIVEDLAKNAAVPVINALTDLEHPCQALACMLTLKEHLGDLRGKTLVFIGDGNNVSHSLMLLAPLAGMNFIMCCPSGYEPNPSIAEHTARKASEAGTTYRLMHEPLKAVTDADLIYSDVWASMGKENEAEVRAMKFKGFQVNSELLANAKRGCLVSHCLPAHRGEEITSEVLDGPQSIALDEAENRLHVQKAVLFKLLKAKRTGG